MFTVHSNAVSKRSRATAETAKRSFLFSFYKNINHGSHRRQTDGTDESAGLSFQRAVFYVKMILNITLSD